MPRMSCAERANRFDADLAAAAAASDHGTRLIGLPGRAHLDGASARRSLRRLASPGPAQPDQFMPAGVADPLASE